MQFKEAVETCLKEKYATFEGRASRSEYWWFQLFFILVYMGILLLGNLILGHAIGMTLGLLCVLAFFIPSLAVGVRRLHDIGKSGWWLLISLIPYIGGLVLLVFYVLKSEQETNKYGPIPAGCAVGPETIEAEAVEVKDDTAES